MKRAETEALQAALRARYSDAPEVSAMAEAGALLGMAARGSCRRFADRDVPAALIDVLCAVALAAPSKSDLQQRDIVIVSTPDRRRQLSDLVADQAWVAEAPLLLVFCGNNRRQSLLHDWADVPFANDHLDAFFNAATDAAIALGAFVTAAESQGLGCCPISGIRNEAEAVNDLLGLPDRVFPFAGLAVGYPAQPAPVSMRLPLGVTCHRETYDETGLQAAIATYDKARANAQPYASQRDTDAFGSTPTYGWSDDKIRQYSRPERADFGAFVRRIGFCLD